MLRISLGLLVAGCMGTASAAVYRVVDLGTLGGDTAYAQAINDAGQIVGTSNGPVVNDARLFNNHAFRWQNGVMTDLGHLGQNESFAFGISRVGDVVGHSLTLNSGGTATVARGFLYVNGVLTDVGFPDGASSLRPLSISPDGRMVGYTTLAAVSGETTLYNRAFVYDPASPVKFQVAGTLEAKGTSVARAMNETGVAVGVASKVVTDQSTQRAIKFDVRTPNILVDLGSLGGYASQANDINASGRIVGVSGTSTTMATNKTEAFIYDEAANPKMKGLGFLHAQDTYSEANAINDQGVIVGFGVTSVGSQFRNQAFVYSNGKMQNLNALIACNSGWELVEAKDINNSGKIVGYGLKDGKARAFLLEPIQGGTPDNCGTTDTGDKRGGGGSAATLLLLPLLAVLRRRRR